MVFGWGKSQEEIDAENADIQAEASICKDYSVSEEESEKCLEVRKILEDTRVEWAAPSASADASDKICDGSRKDKKDEKGEIDQKGYDVLSDMVVLRYLRGNKGVVDKTAHMLGKFITWSREEDIRSITENDVLEVTRTKLVVSEGSSRDGRPCVWLLIQRLNKYTRAPIDVVAKFIMLTVQQSLLRTLPNDERWVLCFDLRNMTMQSMDYEVLKVLISILQTKYPETMHRILIIESPYFFQACWTIIRPWLDPVTASKVTFESYDGIDKYIARDQWVSEYINPPVPCEGSGEREGDTK